jgi:outer membrane protein assembly factor BamB
MVLDQPHGGARARSGVSCQGYLVLDKTSLWIPTGRSVPALFNTLDGKFKSFHLQKNGKKGNSAVTMIDSQMFNHYNIAASPELIFTYSRGTLTASNRKNSKQSKWKLKCPGGASLIAAGKTVFSGAKGSVSAIGVDTKKLLWTQKIDGTAMGLSFAGGRLFISTEKGNIFCMAVPGTASRNVIQKKPEARPYGMNSLYASAAREIIKKTGITEGYCLDLGCGEGQLAFELAQRTKLHIYGIEKNAAKVAAARRKLDAAGLYGVRVTIHQGDPGKSGYPNYFADLVVSGNGVTGSKPPLKEVNRCLRPYGGAACIGKPGKLKETVRGPLKGTGEWTHQYADAGNTVCSDDPVKGPLTVLWFGNKDQVMANRHGRVPAPLFAKGRLYIQGLNDIRAQDAYNGRVIWEYSLPGIGSTFMGDHLVGTAVMGSTICTDGEVLYVRTRDTCLLINGATGKKLGELKAPPRPDRKTGEWGYLAYCNGTLFGSLVDEKHIVKHAYRPGNMNKQYSQSVSLFAMDPKNGKVKWMYRADHSIRHNAIAVGNGMVFLIDRPAAVIDLLKPPPAAKGKAKNSAPPGLLALDASSGRVKWKVTKDVYGTLLAYSTKYDVLLMSYQTTRFQQKSEVGGRMTAFKASSGKPIWSITAKYSTRPLLIDRTIYTQPYAYNLLTGRQKQGFKFKRSYGCGILSAGQNLLLFRSATLGYYDLTANKGIQNYGPIRPGCWINAIPAGGLVLVPDYSEHCKCSYLIKTTLALEQRK